MKILSSVQASAPTADKLKSNRKQKTTPSIQDHIFAGSVAISATMLPSRYIKRYSSEKFNDMTRQQKKYNDSYKSLIDKALECTGLKNKLVEINKAQDYTEELIDEIYEKSKQKARGLERLILKSRRKKLESYMKGTNACFNGTLNAIIVNTDKFAVSAFHEMGHALNYHGKGFTRLLQKSRDFSLLFPVIMLVAAFTPAKMKDEKSKNIINKSTTFIKNNAGKLAFSIMIPTLTEEVLASLRANKIANKISMDKQLLKNMNKSNTIAAITYFAFALANSLSAYGASWIHDKILPAKKQLKTNNIYVINTTRRT